jgi:pimeloyl-ACP methyl ester carboxylesterase
MKWISIALLLMFLLAGCADKHRMSFSLETPPLVLTPTAVGNELDGRGRFREIYCAVQVHHGAALPYDRSCDEVVMRLAQEPAATAEPVFLGPARLSLRILIVSGLFSECVSSLTSAYSYALDYLEQFGYQGGEIRVSGRSSSEHNARQIRDAIIGLDLQEGEQIVLVGYSKGSVDILEALVRHPEIEPAVVAVVSIAGAIGGSPVAEFYGDTFKRLVAAIPLLGCSFGDQGAFESIKPSTRRMWLARHQLPAGISYFSLVSFAEREHISRLLRSNYDRLAAIDPRNDGLLLFWDQVIPDSTLLGYIRADHWAIAMPFSQDLPLTSAVVVNHNKFPREVLFEATIRFVEEVLLKTTHPQVPL